MCVHLYEILAFYIFNVGSGEFCYFYRIDSIYLLFANVATLICNKWIFKCKTFLKNRRQQIRDHQLAIHEEELDEQLDMQMNIAPGA